METDCTTPISLAIQGSINFGPAPLYLTRASEIIPGGYTTSFCYSCVITPTGLPPIGPFTS